MADGIHVPPDRFPKTANAPTVLYSNSSSSLKSEFPPVMANDAISQARRLSASPEPVAFTSDQAALQVAISNDFLKIYTSLDGTASPTSPTTQRDGENRRLFAFPSVENGPVSPGETSPRLSFFKKGRTSMSSPHESQAESKEDRLAETSGNAYKIFFNTMAGAATTNRGADAFHTFKAYVIEMRNVPEIFKDTWQGWNVNYDAAQRIFGDRNRSVALRRLIREQHRLLHRETSKTRTGVICDADGFFDLIKSGIREDCTLVYTYVLMDDSLWFSTTGKSIVVDMMSKHAMHANCARKVRYAGEFHVMHGQDGTRKLIIDNNSGTYAPDKNNLVLLEQVFRANFPGIDVEAYDREDEELEAHIRQMKEENSTLHTARKPSRAYSLAMDEMANQFSNLIQSIRSPSSKETE